MREKWLYVLGATAVLAAFSGLHGTWAAAVSAPEGATEVEDSETEAVIIDANEEREGEVSGSDDEELPRTPGVGRNGKQFVHYFHVLPDALLLPEVEETGNGMVGLPPVPEFDGTCVTNQGKRGNCEKFEKCYPLLNLPEDRLTNGTVNYNNLVDEVYDLSKNPKCSAIVHSGQSNFANVCCDVPSKTERPAAFASPQLYDSQVAFDDEGFTTNPPEPPKLTKVVNTWATCGEKQFGQKIIGGQESFPHEFPWMVSLWGKSGKHICGASLLDNHYVLTAAHCIARYTSNDIGKIRLFIGDHNIHSTDDGHHEVRAVSRIIKHKRFSLQTFVNDIALLKLDRPVPYSNQIRPICLPSSGALVDSTDQLLVAGWGQTSYKGMSASILRKVLVPGVSNMQCENDYNLISPVGITTDMLCAGGKGVDSCIGDSGGPLIKATNGRYEQIGIVSFGRECGTYPGVYTKVHSFLNWIDLNRKKY